MRKKAYVTLILVMITWGTLGPAVKMIHLASGEIVMARIILGIAFLGTVYIVTRRKRKNEKRTILKRDLMLLCISGAVMGFNWVFLFEAYRYTTVSLATVAYYCAPVIVLCLSPILLKEKIRANKIIGITAAMVGMFLITGSIIGGSQPVKGICFGLAAAVFYASVTILNKQIKSHSLTGVEITLIQLFAAGIVVLPYTLVNHQGPWVLPSGTGLICLIAIGIFHTGLALYLYFSCMRILPGQSIAICSYLDPASSLIIASIVLNERMSVIQIIGTALIIGGAAFGEVGTKKE